MKFVEVGPEIAQGAQEIGESLRPMFREQFTGLAGNTHFVTDEEFRVYFEQQQMIRPNLEQMLAVSGAEGHKELRRYARITGREEAMDAFIWLMEQQVRAAKKEKR